MAQNKFITAAEVASIAFSHANSDVTAYAKDSIILLVQRQLLYRDLGKALYDAIGSTPAEYADILADYIKPCLAFAIKAMIAPDMHHKLTNAGGMMSVPQHGRPTDEEGLNKIITKAENIAKGFKDLLIEHLEENKENYPLFTSTTDGPTAKESDPRVIGGWIVDRTNSMNQSCDYENRCNDGDCSTCNND